MEMVPTASTRDAASLLVASWETTPHENTKKSVAPASACEVRPRVTAKMSPASPANSPLAAKAAMVPDAAGMGSLGERLVGVFTAACGVSVPVSGTKQRPTRAMAPRPTITK